MSIEKYGCDYVITCDECGDIIYSDEEWGFMGAVELLKEEGWKSVKNNGEWEHYCPSCVCEEDFGGTRR